MKGFNLIEILIVTAVINILALIGFPLYSHYLTNEKRLEAATMLSKLTIAMEQYHLEHSTYAHATLAMLHFPEFIVKDNYRLKIQSATDVDFQLVAEPLGEQAMRDTYCASLTLDSSGKKGMTGTGKLDDCW